MINLVVKIIMLRGLGFVFFNFFATEFYFDTTEFSVPLHNVKNVNIYKSIKRNINMRGALCVFKLLMASAINRQQMEWNEINKVG